MTQQLTKGLIRLATRSIHPFPSSLNETILFMTIPTMTQQLTKGLVLHVTRSIHPLPSSQRETILMDVGVVAAIIGLSLGPGARANILFCSSCPRAEIDFGSRTRGPLPISFLVCVTSGQPKLIVDTLAERWDNAYCFSDELCNMVCKKIRTRRHLF